MKTFLRTNGKLILFMLSLTWVGSLTVLPYLGYTTVLPPESGLTKELLYVTTVINSTINSLLAIVVGLTLGRRVGLGAPHLTGWLAGGARAPFTAKALLFSVAVGAVAIALTVGVDALFQPHLPALLASKSGEDVVPFWAGMLTMFYGGINEELWMRFGVMSFVVWLLGVTFARKAERKPAWIYVAGIVFAAVMFGVGHLAAAPAMFADVTTVLVVRIVFVNAIAGMFFGALYWKKGLEYAIVAHMVGDIVLHAILG
ncbi:CPBP family intramembrane metalloprotease [Paenibacillus antri]|uniref:CPBP family intramembrane metalloprotease n=1 Tax=Paenibacillus antri TaxID=2582848 RepID=A0A5R9GI50_9BACL|nr:CPBP family glutamic-type intramembrane protease [Paenibacillus antri]TLS51195.1 CPBP family intramembrane metalloprotease [Paenibacillus antri]